jgi:Flp pilus assembly protein TadD
MSKILEVNPRDARMLSLRGVCQAKLGAMDRALRDIEQATLLGPTDAEVLYRKAVVLALAKQFGPALVSLKQALSQGYSAASAALDYDLAPLRGRAEWATLVATTPSAREKER